jgi:hypothetical protein
VRVWTGRYAWVPWDVDEARVCCGKMCKGVGGARLRGEDVGKGCDGLETGVGRKEDVWGSCCSGEVSWDGVEGDASGVRRPCM